jgi:hypothetical protein
MRFGGSWQKLFYSIFVDLERRAEYFWFCLQNICIEIEGREKPFQDGRKNTIQGLVFKRSQGNQREMSKDSGSDERTSSSWWTHSSYQSSMDDLFERFLFVLVLIPSTLIQILSEELDRRLSSVFFFGGHVEIVNKEDAVVLGFGTVLSFSNFIELSIDDILSHH